MWQFLFLLTLSGIEPGPKSPDYSTQVKPILAARCRACHGALQQKGGLRTDTVAFLLEGGNGGTTIEPGKSSESPLIQRLLSPVGKGRMPPEHEGETVPPEEIALLKAWIDAGAPAPAREEPEPDPASHWSFKPPAKVDLPPGSKNPIDAILNKKRSEKGIVAASRASGSLLQRRLHLDLTGLPPTLKDLEGPTDPDSLAHSVEKLLAADAHAERWARHFMDIWRYSDWWGLGAEVRNSHKHIWHWRDWIIDSLRADKPYDQMLREMLAADELYPTDPDRLRATGYLVRPYFLFNRNTWLDDTIEHLGKGILGITFNCARCHDHKYDPISSADYYRLRAIFEPYQVRKDLVPGTLDPEVDALPRVFDCNLQVKTHRYIRGDEKNPDLSRALEPGVPKVMGSIPFQPREVSLPPLAREPGLAPFVAKEHLKRIESERDQLSRSLDNWKRDREQALKAQKSPPPEGKVLIAGLDDKTRWNPSLGQWGFEKGTVFQNDSKAQRCQLDFNGSLPNDFDARLKMTITGGDPYLSVGIAFDADPSREVLVYASAHAPDPKIQVALTENGTATYPEGGKISQPIAQGKEFELRVRVQGKTILVDRDGKQVLHYQLTKERKPGTWRLVTYTATVRIRDLVVREIPAGVRLDPRAPSSPEILEAKIRAGSSKIDALKLEAEAIELVARAMNAQANKLATAQEEARLAAKAQARAKLALAEAELSRLIAEEAPKDKRDAQEKAVASQRKKADNPGESFEALRGSFKSKENNQETQESLDKPFPAVSSGRRTALALWLTDKKHPLTARVVVNHIWTRHMGQPLVPSLFDFGRKGTPPVQKELLDWLAADLVEHGYSLKRLHRLIVTSETYALASDPGIDHPGWKSDPANTTFWRRIPGRLEAEAVRDCILALGGQLDTKVGGPPIPVAQSASKRRALYFFHSHNEDSPFLAQFDSPNVLDCYRREESIVPQQALTLVNSKISRESAAAIAAKLEKDQPPQDDSAFIRTAFRALLGQEPRPDELADCLDAMREWGAQTPARARVNLVHALLNHNDFITIR